MDGIDNFETDTPPTFPFYCLLGKGKVHSTIVELLLQACPGSDPIFAKAIPPGFGYAGLDDRVFAGNTKASRRKGDFPGCLLPV